jgi:hypothetical protein
LTLLAFHPVAAAPSRTVSAPSGARTAVLLAAGEDGQKPRSSWRKYFLDGTTSRSGIVRLCVITMAIALFIMIKKLV